ncbi:RRXRR domain-containing protein [Thermogemmatispora sp.]|uniref:RRXRR domain-containing protein n=1 Tax=Thermogemmatispora sp. TaxID=1968838 RepID=UPI0035E433BA
MASARGTSTQYVPVLSADGKPLIRSGHPARASELVRKGLGVQRFRKGFFSIRLLEHTDGAMQSAARGINSGPTSTTPRLPPGVPEARPGKMGRLQHCRPKAHAFDADADAITHAKKAMATRQALRQDRRDRKMSNRKPRFNRSRGSIPPSAKVRWGWELRIVTFLTGLCPITTFAVEEVKAETRKEQRRWNASFSPLEAGKHRFYGERAWIAPVVT